MLERLAGCSDGVTCPGVWVDEENDEILIRGQIDRAASLPLGEGEQVVAIPIGMLAEAAAKLQ